MSPAAPRAQAVGQQMKAFDTNGLLGAFHNQQAYRAGVNFAGAVPGSNTYTSAQLGG